MENEDSDKTTQEFSHFYILQQDFWKHIYHQIDFFCQAVFWG